MQTLGQGGTRLTQLPLDGSAAYDIPVRGGLSITPNPLRANAIAPDGRILVCVASLSSWFWPVAILDPTARTLSIVP